MMKDKIRILSIPKTATIREAMQAINDGGLGITLVIYPENNSLYGLLTDGDVRRALLNGFGFETPVISITRRNPVVANVGVTYEELSKYFNYKIHVIPILDENRIVVDLAIFDKRTYIPVAEPVFGESELKYVSECVLTGWVSSTGKFVKQFENIFASFVNTKYAISCSNGTSALHLALLGHNIGIGDEVIVPTLTFIATANAVTYTGAKPIFVDSDPVTWNIDTSLIEEKINENTKAIIPVHLYGFPADMDPILKIARRNNLVVIEDAAEAHGAEYKGIKVGNLGDTGVFSFFGNKIITTGEGGMITTNDPDFNERIRMLRDHGMSQARRYWHPILGYNYRLTNIQAALGVGQMERIDSILKRKREIADLYSRYLSKIPQIQLPPKNMEIKNVYWMYSILINEKSRDGLMKYLSEHQIETRPFFPPIHSQPIYNEGFNLPISELISERGINLPSFVTLTDEQIIKISQYIEHFFNNH